MVHSTSEAHSVGVPSFVQHGAVMCPWAHRACSLRSTSLLQVACSPASNISCWDSINIVSKYMFILWWKAFWRGPAGRPHGWRSTQFVRTLQSTSCCCCFNIHTHCHVVCRHRRYYNGVLNKTVFREITRGFFLCSRLANKGTSCKTLQRLIRECLVLPFSSSVFWSHLA